MKKYLLFLLMLCIFGCEEEDECECSNAFGTIVYPCEFESPCD